MAAFGGVEEQEKPASAGPRDLPTVRPGRLRRRVMAVDVVARDPRGKTALQSPPLVQHLPEAWPVPLNDGRPGDTGELAQTEERFPVLLGPGVLLLQDPFGPARDPGVEQGEVVAQLDAVLGRERDRRGPNRVVRPEIEILHASERGDVLVLLSEGPPQSVDLDPARLLGELGRVLEDPL